MKILNLSFNRKIHVLSLLVMVLFSFSLINCNKKTIEETSTITPATTTTSIEYTADNADAPLLPPGEYEMAARFTSNMLMDYTDRKIDTISFFMVDIPEAVQVRVYSEDENNNSNTILYTKDVTDFIVANSWNKHALDTPINLTGETISVSIYLRHIQPQPSIGCDPGPRKENGDLVRLIPREEWASFYELTGGASINWNIKAILSE